MQNTEDIKTITRNGVTYDFDYDTFGNRTRVAVIGTDTDDTQVSQDLVRTEYLPHDGLPYKEIYGNEWQIRNEYDKNQRLIARYAKLGEDGEETKLFENVYAADGELLFHKDLVNDVVTSYQSDFIGRITAIEQENGLIKRIAYDDKDRIVKEVQKLMQEETAVNISYRYGDASAGEEPGLIYGVSIDGTEKIAYTYDDLGRLKKKVLYPGTDEEKITEYRYLSGNPSLPCTTTTLVEAVTEGVKTIAYTYDSLGNITSVTETVTGEALVEKARFFYDALNQLSEEILSEEQKRIVYSYDGGGNILTKTTYPVVEEDNPELISVVSYSYDPIWRDKLISYTKDGETKTISYDAIGNPVNYMGKTMTWEHGRSLKTIQETGKATITYQYDQDGDRISKTVGESVTKYHLDESKICIMETGGKILHFFYDEKGNPLSVRLKDGAEIQEFYYLYNLQQDVVGLIDTAGNQVVSYSYDTWGLPIGMTDTSDCGIGELNPFRYRGYCFDTETGFYYLGSRYYDPITGRFINADHIEMLTTEQSSLLQYNVYAYVWNNPVNMKDAGGMIPLWAIAMVGSAIVEGALNALEAQANGDDVVKAALVGAASGAINGAVGSLTGGLSLGISTVVNVLSSATVGIIGEAIDQGLDNEFDSEKMTVEIVLSGVSAAIPGPRGYSPLEETVNNILKDTYVGLQTTAVSIGIQNWKSSSVKKNTNYKKSTNKNKKNKKASTKRQYKRLKTTFTKTKKGRKRTRRGRR